MLKQHAEFCSLKVQMDRPLAIGAGAGSVSSVLTALASYYLGAPPLPADIPGIGQGLRFGGADEPPPIIWVGLFLGILIGIFVSAALDLLNLFKQYLAVELRKRLATLRIKGLSRA